MQAEHPVVIFAMLNFSYPHFGRTAQPVGLADATAVIASLLQTIPLSTARSQVIS